MATIKAYAPVPMTDVPCPRCSPLAKLGKLDGEMVQPVPMGAFAPRDYKNNAQCFDCNAAQLVQRLILKIPGEQGFEMARIAVGNDRRESLRLPECPVMPLIGQGLMKASARGDLEVHVKWCERNGWFGDPYMQERE